jgi:hypothetical protein
MLHVYKCKKCGARIEAYCFEHLNYSAEGRKTRSRQLDAGLCIPCFGEVPELAKVQTPVPCFNLETGDITARVTKP